MNDRGLLEMAAKAYGAVDTHAWSDKFAIMMPDKEDFTLWNPLDDDGDAFRLSAHLGLIVEFDGRGIVARTVPGSGRQIMCSDMSDTDSDHLPKLRRAIVRAAAAMGEKL